MKRSPSFKFSAQLRILFHLLIWVLVLHFLFDISGLYYSFRELFFEGERRIDEAFLLIPLMVGLFYLNSEFLIPKFLTRKFWRKYLIGLGGSFILILFFGRILFEILQNDSFYFDLEEDEFSGMIFIFSLIVIGISTSLGVSKMALQNAEQKKAAEERQKEAELKYLTAQVNPHFLFNTLNTVYSLANDEEAPKTTDAILKLSEIMRYPIKEGAKNKVLLAKEVEMLRNYIELQKLRLGAHYPIHFEIIGNVGNVEIAPLLFIPFVENAFKYGISNTHKYPVHIVLEIFSEEIYFKTQNTVHKKRDVPSSGVGIENVKKRLALLYPGQYELDLIEKDNQFFVNLNLRI